jgi:hypothetical protein
MAELGAAALLQGQPLSEVELADPRVHIRPHATEPATTRDVTR